MLTEGQPTCDRYSELLVATDVLLATHKIPNTAANRRIATSQVSSFPERPRFTLV